MLVIPTALETSLLQNSVLALFAKAHASLSAPSLSPGHPRHAQKQDRPAQLHPVLPEEINKSVPGVTKVPGFSVNWE